MNKTQPNRNILPEINETDKESSLNPAAEFLEEIANEGTNALHYYIQNCVKKAIGPTLTVLYFRNILDILLAISSLILNSNIDPAKSLLRTLIENILQMKFLLSNETERKAKQYIVWELHEELKFLEKHKMGSEKNKIWKPPRKKTKD